MDSKKILKAIIFDFDGVICESVDVKIEAFRKLFAHIPEHVDEIVAYHTIHGGVSRFKKFEYIYAHILNEPLSEDLSQELGRKFTEYSLQGVLESDFVPGADTFLQRHHERYLLFIASGTPDDEMREVVERRELRKYFKGVYGSPATKKDIIETIIKENQLKRDEILFVGDSITDYNGAKEAGVAFIGRVHPNKDNPFMDVDVKHFINDINGLNDFMREHFL
ncbi:MAG: HAD family hydrolase [Candidatus Omnitrophica bacterium]|nr:HAD family hydrolase [Candidatus Omnitrophota bacterium]